MQLRPPDKTTAVKRSLLAVSTFVVIFAGCNRNPGGGINTGAGGFPASSSTPVAEISTSAQVVKVSTQYMPRSSSTFADVVLTIAPGFHINANPATYPYLIATEVQPGKAEGIEVLDKDIIYPPAEHKKFDF